MEPCLLKIILLYVMDKHMLLISIHGTILGNLEGLLYECLVWCSLNENRSMGMGESWGVATIYSNWE